MESMKFFLNELSLGQVHNREINDREWIQAVEYFLELTWTLISLRPDSIISLPEGTLSCICGGKTLLNRIHECTNLRKDHIRKIRSKIKEQPTDLTLIREVHHQETHGHSITLADIQSELYKNGWAISLFPEEASWSGVHINALRYQLNETGDFNPAVECKVDNISTADHIDSWKREIQDWGSEVCASSVLGALNEHPIVMYSAPLEHNPPHVHLLVSRNSPQTLAKFNISPFERTKGEDKWDTDMRAWVARYEDQLLRSWERCQSGLHPYELED